MEPILREGTSPIRPNLATLQNVSNFTLEYDARFDTIYLVSGSNRPAVSVDCAGELWLRVDVENGDIIGVEIPDFQAVFLQHHQEVAPNWEKLRSRSRFGLGNRRTSSFRQVLTDFLRKFLADCSHQQTLEMMPA